MLIRCILILFTGLLFSQESQPDILHDIQKDYGVTVNYTYSENFFPKSWRSERVSAKGLQIEQEEVKRMLPIIKAFLSNYSKEFIKKNLSDIYLLKSMQFFNKTYGGTSSATGIYIANDGSPSDSFLSARLHSEFSSIVFNKFKDQFPTEAWMAINDKAFQYVGSGVKMLGSGNLYGQSEDLLKKGFIVKYAMSSVENDFNMIIDWIFTKPKALKEITQKYERIKKKYNLILSFYDGVESGVVFGED